MKTFKILLFLVIVLVIGLIAKPWYEDLQILKLENKSLILKKEEKKIEFEKFQTEYHENKEVQNFSIADEFKPAIFLTNIFELLEKSQLEVDNISFAKNFDEDKKLLVVNASFSLENEISLLNNFLEMVEKNSQIMNIKSFSLNKIEGDIYSLPILLESFYEK